MPVPKQLVRAADSVGGNIAEGSGKQTFNENRRYVRIARGSFNEVQHWLRRAFRRKLLTPEETTALHGLIEELGPKLNAYLKSIGRSSRTDPPPRPAEDPPAKPGDEDPKSKDK